MFPELALVQVEVLLREHDDPVPLRRLVGERSELRDLARTAPVDAGRPGYELRRPAFAERASCRFFCQEGAR